MEAFLKELRAQSEKQYQLFVAEAMKKELMTVPEDDKRKKIANVVEGLNEITQVYTPEELEAQHPSCSESRRKSQPVFDAPPSDLSVREKMTRLLVATAEAEKSLLPLGKSEQSRERIAWAIERMFSVIRREL